jgi:hypothetical protein
VPLLPNAGSLANARDAAEDMSWHPLQHLPFARIAGDVSMFVPRG